MTLKNVNLKKKTALIDGRRVRFEINGMTPRLIRLNVTFKNGGFAALYKTHAENIPFDADFAPFARSRAIIVQIDSQHLPDRTLATIHIAPLIHPFPIEQLHQEVQEP